MKDNDAELIRRTLAGDETAFTMLVNKYRKHVHTLAWHKIGDFHIAEDITQETFLQVYRDLATLKEPDRFPGWLYVVTNHRCIAWVRKNRLHVRLVEDVNMAMKGEAAYSQYVANEQAKIATETQQKVVKQLLAKLQESERTVMTLYYFGEMTCEEISKFLGVSVNTIKSRLSRARQRLKKEEPIIREALDSFQLSTNLTQNIMRRIAHIRPIAPSSYCDSFHIGVKTMEAELGISLIEVNGMENNSVVSESVIREAAQNSDLVLTSGCQLREQIARIATEFPNVKFAIFDAVLDIPNVVSVNYKANEGSFLVGAIAALKTESGKIGFVGGADIPLIHEFEAGYVAGIQAINPDTEISIVYISKNPTGFSQSDKAKQLALAQYESGVDVIYVAAGGSGHGVLEAAQAKEKYIIWVDANGNHLAPGIVLTSMVKELSASVQRVIRETVEDRFIAGIRYFGLKDGGVSYTVDEHNQSLLSDEVVATVEALRTKIIAGEIVVPNTVSIPRE